MGFIETLSRRCITKASLLYHAAELRLAFVQRLGDFGQANSRLMSAA